MAAALCVPFVAVLRRGQYRLHIARADGGRLLFSPLIFVIGLAVCIVLNLMAALIPAWISLRNPIVESMNEKK